ncbi:hypothetical protein RHS01_07881 [Rhizoctonia solani]|uniref:Uncharacterized protein n=1 Tax=Rhizoctonia solani TaxID=456999 RepID=A0A8H7M4T0_9AGAM|nr:hypothetical protein RHS01_07881 [Rhizoctonia solani]
MIQELASLNSLKELEINAKPGAFGAWVPEDLLGFRNLQSLTLIMPARSVVELLPAWCRENKDTLESLVIICKSLALETCSPRFNMGLFASDCEAQKRLRFLTSISLTVPTSGGADQRRKWFESIILLLKHSPLESFQLYAGGGTDEFISYEGVDHEAIKELIDLHASTLRRIGIQRLIVPLESMAYACEKCSQLEEIFATLCGVGRDALAQALVAGKRLRNVHLTLMTDVAGEMRPLHLLTAQEICQHIARNCGDSLQLIGSQTRVWQVTRSFSAGQTVRTLGPYSGQQIPEQFLMMRA